jgi:hypothetical protein
MDGGLEDIWLMDSGCSRHMTKNKKWFSSLTPLSHKEYVTFGDDKKGKVLGIDVIKVNDCFTLNDVALVDRLRYNLFSVSQLVDADLSVLFCKLDSHVLDYSGSMFVASTVMKMNHYFLLHHQPSLFLLPHLKQRLLRLLPLPQQQWRRHGLRRRSSSSMVLPLTFKGHIHLNKS